MPTYSIGTRIDSNVAPELLIYDLSVWRTDATGKRHTLLAVNEQTLQSNYETQKHTSRETSEPLSVIYIMEVMLYRKLPGKLLCLTPEPFTRMYTLAEFSTDKARSSTKRENPYYFETTGELRPVGEGDNTLDLTLSTPERPFIAQAYPEGDVWDPFDKDLVEAEIEERLAKKHFPNQGKTSLCGPAAFFYCLQVDRPDVYAQAARELWRDGKTKIGGLEIVPGKGCRHPSGKFYEENQDPLISGLDWITLASLRDSENLLFSYDTVDSPASGTTMWNILTSWFEKAGYEKVFSNVGATQAGIEGINSLNRYIEKGYRVVTLINDGLLIDSDSTLTVPTHWIVWDKPVTRSAKGEIALTLFSWGSVAMQIKPTKDLSFFVSRFFGGMVFKPLQ